MRKLIAATVGVIVATGYASDLYAAAAADGSVGLEEVVVTAQKKEQSLQKTSISIQTYEGKTLVKEGKKKIDDIMRGVVGVQAQDNQTGASFSMRGVDTGTGGPPNQNPGATVAILVDGIYQTRAETARSATLDVSRVEVMRGTQSTNLGASALAGAVSLVSNKPNLDRTEANGSLEFGNYNTRNLEAVYNAPLGGNQAIRFAGSLTKRDGYLRSGAGDNDITNGRVKYRYKPSDAFDLTLTINSQHLGGNGVSAGVLTYEGNWEAYNPLRNANFQGAPSGTCGGAGQPTCYDRVMGYPGLFGHVDTPVTWKQRANPWDDGYPANVWPNHPFRDTTITQYSAEAIWNTSVGTLTVTPEVETAHFHSAEPPRGNSWMSEDRYDPTRQVEVRFASPATSKAQWMAGAYYYHHDQTGTFETIVDPYPVGGPPSACGNSPYNCYTWANDAESSLTTTNVFGQVSYPFVEGLRGVAGLRYSRDKRTVTSDPNGVVGNAYGPQSGYNYVTKDGSWNGVSYRAGLEWDVRPQSMAYLMFATGYQPGVVVVGGPPPGFAITSKNTSTQITLGIKNRFLENRLQLNAEAFLFKFKDRPFTDATSVQSGNASCLGPPGSVTVVASSATDWCVSTAGDFTMPNQKSQGLDLDASYLPSANDRFDLTFEYLDSTYGASPVAASDYASLIVAAGNAVGGSAAGAQNMLAAYNALLASYKGVTLQNAPKTSGNLTYEHTFQFANGSTFAPRLNLAYKAKYWAQGGGPPPANFNAKTALDAGSVVLQDSYVLWNAFATWSAADGKFSITGYMKNIANKAIQTNLSAEPGSTLMAITLDAPRTFGITLNASL